MLTYYSLRIGLVLALIVPQRLAFWLSAVIGNLAFYCNGSARRAVQDNMRHVLGPTASRRRVNQVSRGVFRNAVKNYYELLCLPRLSKADIEHHVQVVGAEHLEAALQGGRGVILCSGHIGNFSLATQMAGARGYPTNIIAEQISPPRLHELVNGLRSRFGVKMIPLGPTAVRAIHHALRANEVIGLAADRDLTESGIPVEFFGELTDLPSGLATLALRLRVPLVPAYVVRKTNDTSVVTVYPPLQFAQTGDRERDTQLGTQQIAHVVEEMIRQTPDQWVVLQRVWPAKAQPGQPQPEPRKPRSFVPRALRPPAPPAVPEEPAGRRSRSA